jgi:hypothetical protein
MRALASGAGLFTRSERIQAVEGVHTPRPAPARQVEASSARNGVGVVKLMGRMSGFIAMQASMASGEGARSPFAAALPPRKCPTNT